MLGFLNRRLKPHWRSYLFQCLCATVAVFLAVLLMGLRQVVIISSIGATAFIVFTMPSRSIAHTRNILGGHLIGFLCGWGFSTLPENGMFLLALIYALAVGSSIFLMVITETEHPPAAGTALGVALYGVTPPEMLHFLLSVLALALVHRVFKKKIRDLL